MLALDGATLEAAMLPRPWSELNTLHALLGGLARLSGRALVLPAINCTDTVSKGIDFMRPGMLPNRCFWHVHSKAGVACVFRLGGCGEAMDIVAPSVLQAALRRSIPPKVLVDMREPAAAARGVQQLLGHHAEAEVVMLRLRPPSEQQGASALAGPRLAAATAASVHPNSRRPCVASAGAARNWSIGASAIAGVHERLLKRGSNASWTACTRVDTWRLVAFALAMSVYRAPPTRGWC